MLLQVSGLVTGYAAPIIGPLNFALAAGEALGIVGANGCGKSTLLKSFYGQSRIFSGEVKLAPGAVLACQQQHPVRLQQVPLSVREYLALMDAEHEALPARLAALQKKRIDTLSGGQYQLLAVWACLASSADLVLLDEPTNNLDPDGVQLLAQWLREKRAGRGLLLISHDADFMHEVCDRQLDVTPAHRHDMPAGDSATGARA